MEFAFVHIGMLKTATTYMQNLWFRNERYCLSWKGNINFKNQLRNAIINNNFNDNFKIIIDTDQEYKKGQKLVISNEGFSTGYLNETKYQDKIPEFVDNVSRILGKLPVTNENLLLVVREPISWIRSTYIQAVKQGWSGTAQDFVNDQALILKHSLNLDYIFYCYSRYFNNILILPYEILKEDESHFWSIISEHFKVPLVEERLHKLNVSFDLKRVYILSKMNEMSRSLLDVLANSKSYTNSDERNQLIKGYSQSGKWVHRRFVEHASENQLNDIYNLFNIENIPDDFLEFKLPEELIRDIKNNYIDFLQDFIDKKYLSLYKEKL